jgi:hypothetical protein
MSDPKLTAQMLDLSRNIEKLTGAVKTNTESTDQLQKANSDSDKGLKDVVSNLKDLNFKEISKEFKDISKNIKDLDFKKIGEDFKGVTKSFGDIGKSIGDIKSLKDIPKSFGDISKSLGGIKDLGKDFKGIKDLGKNIGDVTKDLKGVGKIKDIVSGGVGKKILGAFADGGPVDETGSYLVGERGPEVVKLNEGSNVIPNEKLVTADQKLTEKKGPTEKQIAKYKDYLLGEYPDYYEEYPEFLEDEIKDWISFHQYQSPEVIDSLLEGKGETFTKEDVAKLTSPTKTELPDTLTAEGELSKKDKRKKEKEEERIAKDKARAEKKEANLEKSAERKEKFSGLIGNIKESGKSALEGKDISKVTGLGAGLLSKNIKTDNPLLKKAADIGIKTSADKLGKSLENPELISNVLPLKKAPNKKMDKEEKKSEVSESIEPKKAEQPKASTTEASTVKSETVASDKSESAAGKSSEKSETNLSKADIDDMKSALFRMVSLLEGTLMVSTIESPFRPNSKRI